MAGNILEHAVFVKSARLGRETNTAADHRAASRLADEF